MKKTSTVLACLLLSMLCASAVLADDVPHANAAYGTPVVDGQIDEVWANAETYTASALKDGTEEGITTEWKALWDEKNLYVLIETKGDTKHFFNGDQSWGDGVELYIDALNNDPEDFATDDGVVQIGVKANATTDAAYKGTETAIANIEGKYQIVAVENADGYTYEISIAMEDFCSGFHFKEGTVLGFDIQINSKSDDAESRTSAYGWADTTNIGWQYPYVFGDLELAPAPVVEAETEAEVAISPDTATTAPATFDAGVLAALAAIVSAAGFAISKKH